MIVNRNISPAVLSAAVTLLQPYAPELSAKNMVEALKSFNTTPTTTTEAPIPQAYTRKEAAEILKVSLQTVNRYMNRGMLRRIRVGERLIRINPQDVMKLLNGNSGEDAEA